MAMGPILLTRPDPTRIVWFASTTFIAYTINIFDRVNHSKLFEFLLAKGFLCVLLECCVTCTLVSSLKCAAWNNAVSVAVYSNELRQGFSLSPFLYGIYIDDVLNKIAET